MLEIPRLSDLAKFWFTVIHKGFAVNMTTLIEKMFKKNNHE